MSEKWEYVVKGGKYKQKSQMSTKEIKQIKENNLNGNKYNRGVDEETDQSIFPESNKIPSKNKNKTKVNQKGDGEGNLHQQISKLNSEKIKMLHKDLSEKFPTQPTVVLMDLANYLNLMLKPSEDSLRAVTFDNIDFPYGFLLNDTKSTLRSIFTSLNNTQLGNFLKSAMIQIGDDNEKGIKSVALLMLVQVCLKMKPTALIANRKSIFELMNMYRGQTVKFKCLVWVLKQACLNFNVACQIWLIYLLPFISQRCHTETVLLFGEEMMNYPTDACGNESALLHTDFLPIVDLVFNQATETDSSGKKGKKKQMVFQLAPAHLQRLGLIYLKIKDQIFTSKATASLKDYFASLFFRLSPKNKNEDFNKELLDCLDHCLLSSPESIKLLEHLYLGHPLQTKIFLDHFKSGKSSVAAIIMKQKSYKTMIEKIHSSTMAGTSGLPQDRPQTGQMKSSYHQSSKSGSCVGTLLKAVIYTTMLALFACVVISYLYPQHYKMMEQKIKPIYFSMVEKTTPHYMYCKTQTLAVVKVIQPYATKVVDRVKLRFTQLWTLCKPYVESTLVRISEIGEHLYRKVEEVAPEVLEKTGQVYLSIETYIVDGYTKVVNYLSSNEVQTVVKSVASRMESFGEQVQVGYKATVAYMLKVVGY